MTSSEEDRAASNPPTSPGATATDGEKGTTKPALKAETEAAATTEIEDDIEEGEEKEEVAVSNNDKDWAESHNGAVEPSTADAPPLPDEAPPLPAEAPPGTTEQDDGWAPVWEESAQAFYFYNRFTGATQWSNPRVPDVITGSAQPGPPGVSAPAASTSMSPPPPAAITGYNPAIHGDYDPKAWYAQPAPSKEPAAGPAGAADPNAAYAATAAFNRFTGRFQTSEITPENYNDENKSKRQMNAFFDVDAAANSHDGRSLKAERSGKKLTKTELKQFKEKRKAKKEEKRRAWLRD